MKKCNLVLFFIVLLKFENINTSDYEKIVLDGKNFQPQCMNNPNYSKITEYIYENKNKKSLIFIQGNLIKELTIYKSKIKDTKVIFHTDNKENSEKIFSYIYTESSIDYYFIKVQFNKDGIICFNLYDGNGMEFQKTKENEFLYKFNQKLLISTDLVINEYFKPTKELCNRFFSYRINEKIINKNIKIKNINFNYIYEQKNNNKNTTIENNTVNNLMVYKEKDYYYLPIYINDKNVSKFVKTSLNISLIILDKNQKNEFFEFEIEKINTFEITYSQTFKFGKNISNNIPIPSIMYTTIKNKVYERHLEFTLISNGFKNKEIKPILTSYYNISNEMLNYYDNFVNPLIVLNKEEFKKEKYKNVNLDLMLIIIDKEFTGNDLYFDINMRGNYELIDYNENYNIKDFVANENGIVLDLPNCLSKFYIYYIKEDKNFENNIILDYEVIKGELNIGYTNNPLLGGNFDEFWEKTKNNKIAENNSLINPVIQSSNFSAFNYYCTKRADLYSIIYAFKQHKTHDFITFKNQRALILLDEFTKEYKFTFNEKEKMNIIIKLYKTDENVSKRLNIEVSNITKEIGRLKLNNKEIEIKNIIVGDKIKFKVLSEMGSGSFILIEIIKNINLDLKLQIVNTNKFNETLEKDKILYIYKNENIKNYEKIKIVLYKTDDSTEFCIHKGKGKYPYIVEPKCDKYIKIENKNEDKLILEWFNQTNNKDEEDLYYSIKANKEIKFDVLYHTTRKHTKDEYHVINSVGEVSLQLDTRAYKTGGLYYQINFCNKKFENENNEKNLIYFFNEKIINKIDNDFYGVYNFNDYGLSQINFINVYNSNSFIFKYLYKSNNDIKLNSNYDKSIEVEEGDKEIKITLDNPFITSNDLVITLIFSPNKKGIKNFGNKCELYDFYNKIKYEKENQIDNKYIYSKEIKENSKILQVNISTDKLRMFETNKFRIFAFVECEILSFNAFYNEKQVKFSLFNYKEHKQNLHSSNIDQDNHINNFSKKLIVILVIVVTIFMLYLFRRKNYIKRTTENIENQKRREMCFTFQPSHKL